VILYTFQLLSCSVFLSDSSSSCVETNTLHLTAGSQAYRTTHKLTYWWPPTAVYIYGSASCSRLSQQNWRDSPALYPVYHDRWPSVGKILFRPPVIPPPRQTFLTMQWFTSAIQIGDQATISEIMTWSDWENFSTLARLMLIDVPQQQPRSVYSYTMKVINNVMKVKALCQI